MEQIKFDANEMAQLRGSVDLIELITPTNYGAEKQRWLDGDRKFFNPTFVYDEDAIKGAIRKLERLAPVRDLANDGHYEFFRNYGRLARESLTKRCAELDNLKIFLSTLVDDRIPGDDPLDPLAHLYGSLEPEDIATAEEMINHTPEGLNGMFSSVEKEKLKAIELDAEGIAKYLQLVLDYIRGHAFYNGKMASEERANPTYHIEVDSKYTAVSVNAFSSSGKSVIGIPADRKVSGLKLVELVGHELNAHYRSAMNTRSFFRNLLGPYDDKCPILPLIPMMAHSLNETLSEGLAKVNDVRVSGKTGLPKPYQILAMDFVRKGHNFKETMEYVFELTRQNRKTENTAYTNAWNYTYRIFRGQRDTSSKCGYAFTKDKVYLCGYLTVTREAKHWNDTSQHCEPFMSLLRYSTLTLDELHQLDKMQSAADRILGHDAYKLWSYHHRGFTDGYTVPDPVEYVASLLLN